MTYCETCERKTFHQETADSHNICLTCKTRTPALDNLTRGNETGRIVAMTPERQKILAGEILDLSDKIDSDVQCDNEPDLEDYANLQKLAAILARQVVSFASPEAKKDFIDEWKARPDPNDDAAERQTITRKVRYTCDFEATVEYDPKTEDEQDAVSDIDIPEGGKNDSRYLENTFNILDGGGDESV